MKWPRIHTYTRVYVYKYPTKKSAGQQLSHHYASSALTHEYSYSRVYIYFPTFLYSFLSSFLSFFSPLSISPFNSLTGEATVKFIFRRQRTNDECNFFFPFFFFCIHYFASSRWRGGGVSFLFVSRLETRIFSVLITVNSPL